MSESNKVIEPRTPILPQMAPLSPIQPNSPIEANTPELGICSIKSQKQIARESWKNWLSQQSSMKDFVDPEQQKKSLAKKMRSLRFLNKIKEKKKRKDTIKKQLEKVENKNKRRISSFFDASLISIIRRKSNTDSMKLNSGQSSDPTQQLGEMSPDAKRQADTLKNFNGNEFNYHMIDKHAVKKRRQEIIKWSKNLYCMENRMVNLDKYAK